MFQTCLLWLVRCCCGSLVLKICSTEHWQRMADLDLITDWQERHMQGNKSRTRLTWQKQRSKTCLQFDFFSRSYNTKYLGSAHSPCFLLCAKYWFVFLEKRFKSSCTAAKVGCGKPETGKNRKAFIGLSAPTIFSQKRSQTVLSRNSFMEDERKLMTRSWCQIHVQ